MPPRSRFIVVRLRWTSSFKGTVLLCCTLILAHLCQSSPSNAKSWLIQSLHFPDPMPLVCIHISLLHAWVGTAHQRRQQQFRKIVAHICGCLGSTECVPFQPIPLLSQLHSNAIFTYLPIYRECVITSVPLPRREK